MSAGIFSFTLNMSLARSLAVSTALGVNCALVAMKLILAGNTASSPSSTIRASSPTFSTAACALGRKMFMLASDGSIRLMTLLPAAITLPVSAMRYSTRPSFGLVIFMSLWADSAVFTCA